MKRERCKMKKTVEDSGIKYRYSSVQEDGSQVFLYRTPGFFSYINKSTYPENNCFCVTDHWHDEIEFVYCTDGSMQYHVEGETIALKAGQGLFVNSRRLHVAASDNEKPCSFINVIIHPMLLCASKYVDRNYVEPIIKNSSLKYLFLDMETDWQAKILTSVEEIYDSMKEPAAELKVQSLFFTIWQIIYLQGKATVIEHIKSNHHLNTLKEMISYIQQHYQEKIALEDIAASGAVGKTMCTKLFTTYVNRTPFEFLKDYRIEQSLELLKTTDLSITDISYETGFSSPSYFGECFRTSIGCSPLEYRRNNSQEKPLK